MALGTDYLTLVNKVMVRLREDEVGTVTETDYSTLIGSFVNLVKKEVEASWKWFDLRNSWQVITEAGTATYSLTDCPARALPLDVWNLTSKFEMEQIEWREMNRRYFVYGLDSAPQQLPYAWTPNGTDVNGDYKLDLWPPPDGAYTLQFNMYAPTAELAADTDLYYGPVEPLIEGVLAYAYKERGEDGGLTSKEQFQIYHDMLAQEISKEQGSSEGDTTWNTGV